MVDADDSPKVSAIILAGGKSSRMGKDKASLILKGESLVERLVRIVSPLVANIVIMLHPNQKVPGSFKSINTNITMGRDSIPHQGPLQGISDAMNLLPQDSKFVIVLACDLPFLVTNWLQKLISVLREMPKTDAVVSKDGPFLNPLIAIYRRSVLESATDHIKAGKRSCLALLDNCSYHHLELPQKDAMVLTNINTPEEYQQALKQINRNE